MQKDVAKMPPIARDAGTKAKAVSTAIETEAHVTAIDEVQNAVEKKRLAFEASSHGSIKDHGWPKWCWSREQECSSICHTPTKSDEHCCSSEQESYCTSSQQ